MSAPAARDMRAPAKAWDARARRLFFRRLARAWPDPKSELAYTNPYTLLVAVILSAQATDKGVNKATAALFPRADTPQKMLALGEAALRRQIQTIGLYRNKARHVVTMSRQLLQQFGGEVPRTRSELMQLAGVGRKTANVVLNIAFGQETFAVDTHIFRLGNRTQLAPGKTVEDVEAALERDVPPPYRQRAHHLLILHGRYVCRARQPRCGACQVSELCLYEAKNL